MRSIYIRLKYKGTGYAKIFLNRTQESAATNGIIINWISLALRTCIHQKTTLRE